MAEANKMVQLSVGRGRGTAGLRREVQQSAVVLEHKKASDLMRGTNRDNRSLGPRTRPPNSENKEGTSGKKLSLCANYFRLIKTPDFEYHMYRVEFDPQIDSDGMRKAFIFQQKDFLGGYLYDGVSMVYVTHRLAEDFKEFQCVSRENQVYKVSFKHVGDIQMSDSQATQVLNLILRRTMQGLKMQLVGRNLYDPETKIDLTDKGYKVELWPGYITSIRQHEKDILVCAEVSHKVMRKETVYDILRTMKSESNNWQDKFKREIIGTVVLTGYNNRTYRVDDVDFTSSPKSTFKQKDVDITYEDYYKDHHKLEIRDVFQPMLVSKPKARDIRGNREQIMFLVPELCRTTGLTDKMRNDFKMMKAMAEYTQMDPSKRKSNLLEFVKRLHKANESTNTLKTFETDIAQSLEQFPGRALSQESIMFGESKTAQNDDRVDWTDGVKKYPMFNTVPLSRWAFIYPEKLLKESGDFLKLMMEVAMLMRYELGEPRKVEIKNDRIGDYVDALKPILQKNPKLVMIIVPNNAADRYAAIKKLSCLEYAVPTQVIVKRTVTPKTGGTMKNVMSIATKVIVQLNCKLGGNPWMVKLPIKGFMAIGFDVTHNTRDRSKSFGAFVALMGFKEMGEKKYFSAVSSHGDGAELSKNIWIHMNKALQVYKDHSTTLPERIFFYRDGVGDGQIEYVYEQEVKSLETHIIDLYRKEAVDSVVKFTFILVNKRLNTRIFLNKGSNVVNPPSGTVCDNTITLPERYDFFLVSQSVRQGTVAPTSYNVIHDTNGLNADQLQVLTYKLCHLYYNWSGAVRVPSVVQYAHKLALLSGEFLHEPPSVNFENQLYFL